MFLFEVILVSLSLFVLINARAIRPPSSGSGGDQYQKLEGKGNSKHLPVQSQFSQSDATDRAEEIKWINDMMRILTKANPIETQRPQDHVPEISSPENRHKRSYFPYSSEFQMQWPQFKDSHSWDTKSVFPVHRQFVIPATNANPNKNSKYNYYDNIDSQSSDKSQKKSRPSRKISINQLMVPDRLSRDPSEEKPIWDITAYHHNTAKSSRQSRSSKRELTMIFGVSGTSQESSQLTNDYPEDNEIQAGPLTIAELKGPSRCAWAIISCCSASSEEVNHRCFREQGCAGPFWDVSPCNSEFTKAAIQNVLFYYNSKY